MYAEHRIVGASEIRRAVMPGASAGHFNRIWGRWKRMPGFPAPAPGMKQKWVWGHIRRWLDRTAPPETPTADLPPDDQAAVDYSTRMAAAAGGLH